MHRQEETEAPAPTFDFDSLLQNRDESNFLGDIIDDSPVHNTHKAAVGDDNADARSMHSDTSSVDSEILARREAVKKYGESDSDEDDLEYEHDDDDDEDEADATKPPARAARASGSEEDDDSTEFV